MRLHHRIAVILLCVVPFGCVPGANGPHSLFTPQNVRDKEMDPAQLQAEIVRYADTFIRRTSAAADQYAETLNTPAAREQALTWKTSLTSAAIAHASGPNPTANLVDLISLASIIARNVEAIFKKDSSAPEAVALTDTARTLYDDVWDLARRTFNKEQQEELFNQIDAVWSSLERGETNNIVWPEDFDAKVLVAPEQGWKPNSIFQLVGLDPVAGLDPAVREVTRTRLFAERAMFVAQRMPQLARWQADLLILRALEHPQIQTAVAAADRTSASVEEVSATAQQINQTAASAITVAQELPAQIAAERQAVVAAFEANQGPLRDLTAEARMTLDSGKAMADSLSTVIGSADTLVQRFGIGTPTTGPAEPKDPNARPFDISDYTATAAEVTSAAKEINSLLTNAATTADSPALDRRLDAITADVTTLTDHTAANVRGLLTYAALLAAGLLVLAFALALAYHSLKPRAH